VIRGQRSFAFFRIPFFADADETTATRKNTLSVFYQVGSDFVQSGEIHFVAK
jgi:hypothetical protein